MENLIKALIPVVAMVIIGVLCGIALFLGYDGVLLSAALAIVAGLGGFTTKAALDAMKKTEEPE